MNDTPEQTRIVSRGRLTGVRREHPMGGGSADTAPTQSGRERHASDDLDTQTFEVLYYRARLVLGEPLPRPGRFAHRPR